MTGRRKLFQVFLVVIMLLVITYCIYSEDRFQKLMQSSKPRLTNEINTNALIKAKTSTSTVRLISAFTTQKMNSSVTQKISTAPSFLSTAQPSFTEAANITTNCTLWQFPDQLESYKPSSITLDSNRFLYPGLIWGPNNQINGLNNAIYLAITLNRTLVIPNFRAQHTNPGLLSPYQAIDVERLCRFVSCLSLEEFRIKCNSSFDLAFQIRTLPVHQLNQFEKDSKMSLLHPKRIFQNISFSSKLTIAQSTEESEIPVLPNQNSSLKFNQKLPSDRIALKTAFDTSAQCVIAVSLYNWIYIKPKSGLAMPTNELQGNISLSDIPDNVLYSIITNAVRHPHSIVASALQYVHEILEDREYIGIHWRYDKQDWMSVCRLKEAWSKFICDNINNIKPKHVANAIAEAIYDELEASNNRTTSLPIYIATPPSEKDFADSIYVELENLNKSFSRPSMSLEIFLTNKHNTCWQENGWTNIPDMISLSEMEIMKSSSWFFYSPGSTWSDNIRLFHSAIDKNGKLKKRYQKDIIKLVVTNIRSKTAALSTIPISKVNNIPTVAT